MSNAIESVDVFSLTMDREKPYLGDFREGEKPNANGYFVRKGNRTVYPVFDRSVLVRIKTSDGTTGWGETYGIVVPGAVGEIINDLLADFTIGRDPTEPESIYQDLYDLMRVRGYTGGFYADALAAIDIAVWDIAAQISEVSITELLGGRQHETIPSYVSGLPENTLSKRVELAAKWQENGYDSFKFALIAVDDDPSMELRELRKELGPNARIACDMHWRKSSTDAIQLIRSMEQFSLWFAEAPVYTEDIAGLREVCEESRVPIAVGEEWRTHWDLENRIDRCGIEIIQPEMGHTGITNFMRIGKLAEKHDLELIPHATIGVGIFLAASLQASAALSGVSSHEYQHSIFEHCRELWTGDMDCTDGRYTPPSGPGLGVQPSGEALGLLKPL